jgi:hypothetical protein
MDDARRLVVLLGDVLRKLDGGGDEAVVLGLVVVIRTCDERVSG